MTWYDEGFCAVANLTDYRMRPDPSTNYPGRTHRFYSGKPVYSFGAGLSYTSFERSIVWSDIVDADSDAAIVSIPAIDVGGPAEDADRVVASVEVAVRNVGAMRWVYDSILSRT